MAFRLSHQYRVSPSLSVVLFSCSLILSYCFHGKIPSDIAAIVIVSGSEWSLLYRYALFLPHEMSYFPNSRFFARRPCLSPLRLGSIEEEISDNNHPHLNLGAESPWLTSGVATPISESTGGNIDDEWSKLRSALQRHIPVRTRSWRSNSFSKRAKLTDADCGIWYVYHRSTAMLTMVTSNPEYSFEASVRPCQTACCGKVFCQEHITDVSLASSPFFFSANHYL